MRIQEEVSAMRNRQWLAVLFGLVAGGALPAQVPEILSPIGLARNVFEVVVAKPTVDPLVYAERLPLENLPYAVRKDPFESIGTAFALPGGRFISAAHVLGLDLETLLSEVDLRDSSGKTYPIGRITSYSKQRDYVVFEVPGLQAPGLPTSAVPAVNSRVFTVGNALGQGVIVREGLFTSQTPEDRNGAWNWLRFSAAASPGNSGGPLMDDHGRVLGIVVMKSENENLNYALPFDQIQFGTGRYDLKYRYSIASVQKVATRDLSFPFDLPLPVADVRKALVAALQTDEVAAIGQIYSQRWSEVFPLSQGSKALWGTAYFSTIPLLIRERTDGTVYRASGDRTSTTAIEKDGSLETSNLGAETYFAYSRPRSAPSIRFSESPRKLMDQVLKGLPITRDVAGTGIRIESFGDPTSTFGFVDRWGRPWTLAQFAIPYQDAGEVLLAHQTPSGAVGILRRVDWSAVHAFSQDYRVMADSLLFGYQAEWDDWKAYLADPKLIPGFLGSLKVEAKEGGPFLVKTSRWNLTVPADLLPLSSHSVLTLVPSWFSEDGVVRFEATKFFLADTPQAKSYLVVEKNFPPATDTDSTAFDALVQGAFPWTGDVHRSEGKAQVNANRLPGADRAGLYAYGLRLSLGGDLETLAVQTKFNQFKNGLVLNPDEGGEPVPLGRIEGMTLFQALGVGNQSVVEQFASQKRDLQVRNGDRRTPLQVALRLGRLEEAHSLLRAGSPVQGADSSGMTALHLALRYGDSKIVQELLDQGADPNAVDSDGLTPLMLAVKPEFPGIAERLLGLGADPSLFSTSLHSALFFALQNGRGDLASELLPKTPKWDLVDGEGKTLMYAAAQGASDETCLMLLDKGLPLGGPGPDGWTTLLLAARYGKTQLLTRLAGRYSPEQLNLPRQGNRETALNYAATYCGVQAVQALLDHGADPEISTLDGFNPLLSALSVNSVEPARALLKVTKGPQLTSETWSYVHMAARYCPEMLAEVVARFPDLEMKTKLHYTPLLLAATAGQTESFSWLLGHGARIDATTDTGQTALILAAHYLGPDEVEALLDKGADPYFVSEGGFTALLQALISKRGATASVLAHRMDHFPGMNKHQYASLHEAVVNLPGLVPEIGAKTPDLDQPAEDGWSPLLLAVYFNQPNAVRWLLDHGADPKRKNNSGDDAWAVARKTGIKELLALLPSRP